MMMLMNIMRMSIAMVMLLACACAAVAQDPQRWFDEDFEYRYGENDGVGYELEVVDWSRRTFAPIHIAAARGDVEIVRQELEKGVPVDLNVVGGQRSNADGATPLHFAAQFGRVEVMGVLIDACADVNAVVPDSAITPLMLATGSFTTIGGDHTACVHLLIEHGADVHAKMNHDATALHFAAGPGGIGIVHTPDDAIVPEARPPDWPEHLRPRVGDSIPIAWPGSAQAIHRAGAGDALCLKMLIASGADVNARDSSGRTPLMAAAQSPDPERVRLLLEAGADLSATDDHGQHALLVAASRGWFDVFQLLLGTWLQANAGNDDEWRQALLTSAAKSWRDRNEKVQALFDAGIEIDARSDFAGEIALEIGGQALRTLLDRGVDPFVRDEIGHSLLHLAAWRGDVAVVDALLGLGIDANDRGGYGNTPLILAAGTSAETLELLLSRGADPSIRADGGVSALHHAAEEGNMRAVTTLINVGADVNEPYPVVEVVDDDETWLHGPTHWTPLMMVAYRGTSSVLLGEETGEEAARALIDAGADVNVALATGETALTYAVQAQQPEVGRMLLEAGAEPDVIVREDWGDGFVVEKSTLVIAIEYDCVESVKLLLEAGADPNLRPEQQWPAIIYAVDMGNAEVVRLLVAAGADVESRAYEGVTPLMLCVGATGVTYGAHQDDPIGVLRVLLEGGARVDAADDYGMTALMHLCQMGFYDLEDEDVEAAFELLRIHGANIHARDKDGRTPLHHAAWGANRRLVERVLENGADLYVLDKRGRNALDHARLRANQVQWEVETLAYLEELFARE